MVETFRTIAGKPSIDKDPNAVLDYTFDFTDWLLAGGGDTILSHTVAATVGVTVASSGIVTGGKKVVVWVAGGTIGAPASVTVRIVTANRTEDRTMYFKIKAR